MKKSFLPFSSSALKIIACITMVIDHVGFLFFPDQEIWRIIGRLSFPLFAFLIAEGYHHTKDVRMYVKRLFLFALISQLPYMLLLHAGGMEIFELNVFFTLLTGLLALIGLSKLRFLYSFLLIIATCFVAQFFHFSYGAFGMITIFTSYLFLNNRKIGIITLSLIPFVNNLFNTLQWTAIFSLPFIALYDGKKGFSFPRYFFYWFYPAHIVLLCAIWYFFI